MVFLINCSNLKAGGGLQVADSICCMLKEIPQHQFVVILSSALKNVYLKISNTEHIIPITYDIKNSLYTLLLGRDSFLDNLVIRYKVNSVLTVFGPSKWIPKCPHLCGFARAQLILKDSPYLQHCTLKEKLSFIIWKWAFKRSSKIFYTENDSISKKIPEHFGKVKVYTVTNYYNQVFDHPEIWGHKYSLPKFNGTTILCISTFSKHKNLQIIPLIIKYLRENHPNFSFRFVLTINKDNMPVPDERLYQHILFLGKIDIAECPYLYEQSDIMFMPTLMECFTATYPEAMRMEKPIITTDLDFAHGLCGNAAYYFESTNYRDAAEAIIKVSSNKELSQRLIEFGKMQLKKFDNYNQRAEKLVSILEEIAIS